VQPAPEHVALAAIDGLTGVARRPKRSGIVALWTAFFAWPPVRAAGSFLGHIGLALVCVAGIWLFGQAFHRLFPEDPKFFGWIPIKWFFDAGEAGILATLTVAGIYDVWQKLMRKDR
jgi:hypothetical protein